jgi:hypothetical protein
MMITVIVQHLRLYQLVDRLKYGFSRGPFEGKLAEKSARKARETFAEPDSAIFQASSLHPIIKVVNHFTKELPSGVFNVNDGDSYVEFNAFLREANLLSKVTSVLRLQPMQMNTFQRLLLVSV